MTTADTVFAQPGDPDRLRDYQQNARTVLWALLVAILIHLLVAFLLAAFGGFFSPALPAPEKPVELTFMVDRRAFRRAAEKNRPAACAPQKYEPYFLVVRDAYRCKLSQ